jgi:hypothetical protein
VSEGGAAAAGRPCRGCFSFARPGTVRVRRCTVGGRTASAGGASEVRAVYGGMESGGRAWAAALCDAPVGAAGRRRLEARAEVQC